VRSIYQMKDLLLETFIELVFLERTKIIEELTRQLDAVFMKNQIRV
jgi:hypothetical protein